MDDDISVALARIAAAAPDAGQVAATVQARRQAQRQRRTVLAVAGAGAAATAAVGITGGSYLLTRASRRDSTDAMGTAAQSLPGSSGQAEFAPGQGNTRIPMKYRPGWLPEGYTEISRTVSVRGPEPGRQRRTWHRPFTPKDLPNPFYDPGMSPTGLIHLETAAALPGDRSMYRETTVGGKRAWVALEPATLPQVIWDYGPDERLQVTILNDVPDKLAVAQRVAESVTTAQADACEIALEYGWLPEKLRSLPLSSETYSPNLTNTPAWGNNLSVLALGNPGLFLVKADLQNRRPPHTLPGKPATLRGRPGLLQTDRPQHFASVVLDNDHWVLVTIGEPSDAGPEANLTPAEIVKIVNELRIGPDPDTKWLKL
jgi:hypothetical protein